MRDDGRGQEGRGVDSLASHGDCGRSVGDCVLVIGYIQYCVTVVWIDVNRRVMEMRTRKVMSGR